MNPFPPNSNAYINYEFGMGFPPLDFAPNLWNDFHKEAPLEIQKAYPLLDWSFIEKTKKKEIITPSPEVNKN